MAEECPDCGAPFADPAELVAHVQKAHATERTTAGLRMNPYAAEPGFPCSLCGARFATPQELAAHALSPHSVARPTARRRPGQRATGA